MSIQKRLCRSLAIGIVLALALGLFGVKRIAARAVSGGAAPSASVQKIDGYLEGEMGSLKIPGISIAIVEADRIVHTRGFGRALPGGEAPTARTPFFIGSLTKSVTAMAVMQLVEAGKIDLDAPVQRYLPWFRVADPRASVRMTVRHLLNQTSGLPLGPGWQVLADFDRRPDATERQARTLATLELTRSPGDAFEYSNSNYSLLGLIVEAVTGEPYADYIQSQIFAPLGMRHSYSSEAEARQDGLAVGHQYWFTFPLASDQSVPYGSLPAGGLISSAEDMAHYLMAHLDGGRYENARVLSSAGIDELHRGVAEASEMGIDVGSYAMGWYHHRIGRTRVLWHTGVVPNFFSYMALLPEQRKAVVVLFNGYHFMMTPALTEVGMGVAALLAGEQPEPSRLGFLPRAWLGLSLIPVLQIAGVAATLGLMRRWRRDPSRRPSRGRLWGLHILLPLIPNLSLAAIPVLLQASGLFRFLLLYMPDLSRLALLSGGFAGLWAILRTGLILRTLRKP